MVYSTEKPFEQSIFEQSETIPPLEFAVQTRGEINFTPRRILPTDYRTNGFNFNTSPTQKRSNRIHPALKMANVWAIPSTNKDDISAHSTPALFSNLV